MTHTKKFYFGKDVAPIGIVKLKSRPVNTEGWTQFMAHWSAEAHISCTLVCLAYNISFVHFTCYIYCKIKSCKRIFRFKEIQFDSDINLIVIMSNLKENPVHPEKDQQHREVSGAKRETIKKMLQEKTVTKVYKTLNQNIDHELACAGNLQHKVKKGVLETMCTEIKQAERTGCTVVDSVLWALSQEWEKKERTL